MKKEGWNWLFNARKWHYFVDGRSLCGKWGLFGKPDLIQGNDDSLDNCRVCRRKLQKRKETKNAK